ncbi:MAG: hypothetical protein ACP5PP_06135 [Fervidobacterium sp.]
MVSISSVFVKMFGEWAIYVDEKKIEKIRSKKALKLLFYLLLSEGSRVSISELSKIFWKGLDEEYVRKNLNVQLYYIRKDLGVDENYIRSEREYVYINKDFIKSDYQAFLNMLKSQDYLGRVKEIRNIYSGALLQGLSEPWIEKHRYLVQILYEEAIEGKRTNSSDKFAKAKVILEHQKYTRGKYFVPILVKKIPPYYSTISVRRGDIVLDLYIGRIFILESGRKDPTEVAKGFLKRLNLENGEIEILSEDAALNFINKF